MQARAFSSLASIVMVGVLLSTLGISERANAATDTDVQNEEIKHVFIAGLTGNNEIPRVLTDT